MICVIYLIWMIFFAEVILARSMSQINHINHINHINQKNHSSDDDFLQKSF